MNIASFSRFTDDGVGWLADNMEGGMAYIDEVGLEYLIELRKAYVEIVEALRDCLSFFK